jgi:hypothetical protein
MRVAPSLNSQMTSMNAQADNLGFVTRYFLRRLAIARRKEHRNPRTPFVEAKVEVIQIIIMFPIVGVASFVIVYGPLVHSGGGCTHSPS